MPNGSRRQFKHTKEERYTLRGQTKRAPPSLLLQVASYTEGAQERDLGMAKLPLLVATTATHTWLRRGGRQCHNNRAYRIKGYYSALFRDKNHLLIVVEWRGVIPTALGYTWNVRRWCFMAWQRSSDLTSQSSSSRWSISLYNGTGWFFLYRMQHICISVGFCISCASTIRRHSGMT